MSLQFILGNSGSGKTENTYRSLVADAGRNPGKNYLVLVPEQFTFATQKKLVELSPNGAIMNIDVLSFKRLAYRVFDELGKNDLNVLEETGKNLLLRKVAEDQKENLTVMRPNLSRMGYIDELKSLISELTQYRITPQVLEDYAASPSVAPAFAAKLKDVVTMYRAFRKEMTGGLITAEEILEVLIAEADSSELLRGSVILLDEFTGFTPIQNELLRKLLPIAEKIIVILTMDSGEDYHNPSPDYDLFHLTKHTIASLTRMAEEEQVSVADPVIYGESTKKRFQGHPDLAFLEAHLFRPGRISYGEKAKAIHFVSCNNPREELLYAARQISKLVRHEGCRYMDFALVTGDMNTYSPYVEDIFGKYQIPFFMDSTTEIVFHPFIECIRAILEIIADDFSYESVMRFLKTGFSPFSDEEIDLLDNYLLAVGLRGHKAWENRWLRLPPQDKSFDLGAMDLLRASIRDLFFPLYHMFHPGKGQAPAKAGDEIAGLYELLCRLNSEDHLRDLERTYTAANDPVKAREYGQIYGIVMDLLDKFYALLKDEPMSVDEFSDVLDAGLSAASLATVPLSYDSVTVGDIERTRLNQIHYMFFLGVNDGIIPRSGKAGGIISEFEREEILRTSEITLAPGAREQAFIQRFYLYRMLTKADKGLFLSYSRADLEGKAIRPSYLAGLMQQLFPRLEIEELDTLNRTLNLSTPQAALDYLIHGGPDAAWYALASCFLKMEPEKTEELLRARFLKYENHPLSKVIAEAVYGHHLEGSVTRLESFASCAYAHFLRYGLKLKTRTTGEFESADMGNLYHKALERYSLRLQASAYDWFTIPDPVREEYAENAMEEALLEFPDMSLYATASSKHLAERMKEIFRQTVWALTRQVRSGKFIPSAFELSFAHMENKEQLKVELDRDHYMDLSGVIDRLDLLEEDNSIYIKVIDYKTGNQNFDLLQIYKGLSLQLIVYLNTSMDYISRKEPGKSLLPAALFYYHIDDPVIEDAPGQPMTEEELQNAVLKKLRPSGLVNCDPQIITSLDQNLVPSSKSDVIPVDLKKDGNPGSYSSVASGEEFELLQAFAVKKMKDAGKRIYEGDIAVNPFKSKEKDSCTWCPYQGICQINSRIDGFPLRSMPSMKKAEVLEAMKTELALTGE